MTVGMALAAIKLVAGLKGDKSIKTITDAANGDPKSIAALGKLLGDKFGDASPEDLTTIAKAAVAGNEGGDITDAGDMLTTIEEIGMDKPKDYAVDAAEKVISNAARGFADWQRNDANALIPVLLRRAERRAESPYSQGLLEDMYRTQAAKYARDKERLAMVADRAADTLDSIYGKYRADKDYTKSQKMARVNPMSGNRSLAEQRRMEQLYKMMSNSGKRE